MSHTFCCRTPDCGDGDRRTPLGKVRAGTLVVSFDAITRSGVDYWQVQCPACGRWRTWRGDLAREEPVLIRCATITVK